MKFSKFKAPVVTLMIIAVLSLNFVNPVASSNFTDMKGTVTEMPASAPNSSEAAIAPLIIITAIAVTLMTSATWFTGSSGISTDEQLIEGIAEVDQSSLAMNKLD